MAHDYYNMFDDLQKDMKRFLRHLKDSRRNPADFMIDVWSPNVNIQEGEKNFIVIAEIPGVDPKEMKIIVHGNRLTLAGNRYPESTVAGTKCLHMEIISGTFNRSIELPEHVSSKNVKAKYQNGMLQITLEKLPKEAVNREIPITTETQGGAK